MDQVFEFADFFVGMVPKTLDAAGDFLWFQALGDDAGSAEAQGLVFLFALDAIEPGYELNGREQLHVELFQDFRCLGQEFLVAGDEILHPGDDGVGHMADVREVARSE